MAPIAMIAGAGLQAVGQIKAGKIAESQGKFAEKIAIRNQQALERQAKAEQQAARLEEGRIARREKLTLASMRAGAAKSGVGLSGASINVLADAAFQFSLDRNLRLRRGLIAGQELREKGGILRAQGEFAKTLGREEKRLSYIKAGASILGGIGASGIGSTGSQTFGNQQQIQAAGGLSSVSQSSHISNFMRPTF